MISYRIPGAAPAALIIVLATALSGCATVTRSPSTEWTVNSFPMGAEVKVSNGDHCDATPCTFQIKRKAHFIATLAMPGYETGTVEVKPQIKPLGVVAFLGNGIMGGLIGAAIDLGTGAPLGPSHDGEIVKLKPYLAPDGTRLAVGCTPDKASYAREAGVPCEALSERLVVVNLNPGLRQAHSNPVQTASNQRPADSNSSPIDEGPQPTPADQQKVASSPILPANNPQRTASK
jgi:hypothetical protein